MLRATCTALLLLLFGCSPFPKDSEQTLQQVTTNKILKVGVIEHKPWVFRHNEEVQGIEIKIITEFAKSLNVEPQWYFYPESVAIQKLEENKINIVVGGLTEVTPWKQLIALTRPYLKIDKSKKTHHVIAVLKGENQFMVTLEAFLKKHHEEINLYYQSTL